MVRGLPARQFFGDLKSEIADDNIFNGAAALAYYLMLSLFPAAILLLSLLPYVPMANVEQAIFDFLGQALPGTASQMIRQILSSVMRSANGGLLSFGLVFAL